MAEIFERYGKVAQIDLSATVPRHNSTKRPSITVEPPGVAPESIISDAIKQLTKSMRSESKTSLTDRRLERSDSRVKSKRTREHSSNSKDLTQQLLKNSQMHQSYSLLQ